LTAPAVFEPSLATTATPGSSVGSYPITASGAADLDYAITHLPGLYRVTAAPSSIKADDTGAAGAH